MSGAAFGYVGQELDIFREARNWKRYWASQVQPYLAGDVLEVGAGLGANIGYLNNPAVRSLHCLEPDEVLAAQLRQTASGHANIMVSTGTVAGVAPASCDAVLYADVLEHIEDDKGELRRAVAVLRAGGTLIVLAPAHQTLFNPFDAALGHFRRYDRSSLAACSPPSARLEKMWYLDSIGLLASGANKLLLRQRLPTRRQIAFWDTYIVPASRVLDPVFGYGAGKSILAVWRRTE